MQLMIDTSRVTFSVVREVQPRVDSDGKQRMEKGTGVPMWTVQLVAVDARGGEVINVTYVGANPPNVTVGQFVTPIELQAIPWAQANKNGVAYRASEFKAVQVGKSNAAA